MKALSSIIVCLMLYCSSDAQSASITDIDNHTIVVDSLHGNKILVIILPLQRDTSVVNQLVRFQTHHEDTVKVIGLALWGSNNPSADSIRDIYRNVIDLGVIITQGLGVNVSTSNERESVLKWLSELNRGRQTDPSEIKTKYLVSEGGKLFAQPGKSMSLDNKMMENIIRTKVPGEN